jgi:serine/threonine protein kinase
MPACLLRLQGCPPPEFDQVFRGVCARQNGVRGYRAVAGRRWGLAAQVLRSLYLLESVLPLSEPPDLNTIVKTPGLKLSLPRKLRIGLDVMSGIAHLHEHEIIHRDIKTENVLVDADWRCVVADYGFARRKAAANMTICGTDEFMAPELLFGEDYDEKAVSD